MKDLKGIIESLAVAWATLAVIPGMDLIDFPAILFLSKLLNLTYVQVAIMYYITAILVLIILAPKKLKKLYNQIRRYL